MRRLAVGLGALVLVGVLLVLAVVWNSGKGLHAFARKAYHRAGLPALGGGGGNAAAAVDTGETRIVNVRIDAGRDRHPISPFIYGVADASTKKLTEIGATINRWGGNANTRYNWKTNAWNSARDWEWRNHGDGHSDGSGKNPGEAADTFIRNSRAAGAAVLLTVPSIGWVATDNNQERHSVNVPAQGGLGLRGADGAVAGYDPAANRLATSVRSVAREKDAKPGEVAQDAWVRHVARTFGPATAKSPRFWAIDNEPDLWDSTHTDVHPAQMGYDDMLSNFVTYASAVKDADPSALVTGPVSWGWVGYLYSAKDRGSDNFHSRADFHAHGDTPFLLWFLKNVRASDTKTGRRTLDVLDVHFYPQGESVFSPKADDATRALRLRSVRALYDPQYKDESWINEPIRLLPRLREWIAQGYPGTKIGITEWNFGGENDISGGLANADALGIFGREGVFVANYWTYPGGTASDKRGNPRSPGAQAFCLFRTPSPTQPRGGFGNISVRAETGNWDQVSVYAALDSRSSGMGSEGGGDQHDLTVILINKLPRSTATVPITVVGWNKGTGVADTGTATACRFDASHGAELRPITVPHLDAEGRVTLTLPPYSATQIRFMKPRRPRG